MGFASHKECLCQLAAGFEMKTGIPQPPALNLGLAEIGILAYIPGFAI